jgi:hypothetical protein
MPAAEHREATSLFISHISEEADIALLLKEIVENDFIGAVRLFASSDITSIRGGQVWLDAIREGISGSAAVMVLCSHASVQRPWVQFEIGAAWMKEKTIVPICHSGMQLTELPMPLSAIQGIELGTEKGLKRLYRCIADALHMRDAPEVRDMAERLARIRVVEERFARSPVEQFERFINITIPAPGRLEGPVIPEDARVDSNADTLRLFELTPEGARTWGDIVAAARQTPDQRWLDQLQQCVYHSSQNRTFRSVQAVYHSHTGAYQPQLSRKEALSDGGSMFHVHMVETVVAPFFEVQNEFGLMATLLRLGLRFRYEVIVRCGKLLAALPKNRTTPEDVHAIVVQLRESVETIECDALSRGAENIDRMSVAELFEADEDKQVIGEITDRWDEARAKLCSDDAPLTLEEIRQIIDQMRDVNYRFMRVGTRRFHEMVGNRWKAKAA